MQQWLLTLRFDGTDFCGWQVQPNGPTVQQAMQDAIEAVTGVRSDVTGCSRTDSGVHAEMFCCAFRSESPLTPEKWIAALNAHLPFSVAVYACRPVPEDFHPRYDARGKQYVYRIWNGAARHPMWNGRALFRPQPLDAEKLHSLAQAYVGTHDFSAFCSAGSSVQDKCRTVRSCSVTRDRELVQFAVEADGFLYNMVRIMVGTLLDISTGRLPENAIDLALKSGLRENAGMTVPAYGLYLEKVLYER